MEDFRIPPLAYPFVTSLNPCVSQVESEAMRWGQRLGLLSECSAAYVRSAKIPYLLAWAHPCAQPEQLQLVTDWSIWLVLWDDLSAGPGFGDDPEHLTSTQSRFLRILCGFQQASSAAPLEAGLADLHQRLIRYAPRGWMARFSQSVAEHFDGCVWEATNRALARTPDMASYRAYRPFTGAFYTYVELAGIVDQLILPASVRRHADVMRLTMMANNILCWSNDLFSCAKELRQGEIHNSVLLCRETALSLQEAIQQVVSLHNQELEAFIALAASLPSFGTEHDPLLARYVTMLRCWMKANINWAVISGRYKPDGLQATGALLDLELGGLPASSKILIKES